MARPRNDQPTPAELEVLQLLWSSESLTVREVMDQLNRDRPRAYTSVMSLLNVMARKRAFDTRTSGPRVQVPSGSNKRKHARKPGQRPRQPGFLMVPQPHWSLSYLRDPLPQWKNLKKSAN